MQKTVHNLSKTKIIGVLLFSLILFLTPLPKQKAQAWETWITNPMQSALDEMLKQLNLIITGVAKQGAVKMITQNVYMSVGGSSSGGAKFIVNWESALVSNPKKKAALYIEQLSKNATRMRGSSFYEPYEPPVDYAFEGVGADGLAQYFRSPRFIDSVNADTYSDSSEDYASQIDEIGQSIVAQASEENPCAITYENNPDNMFNDGTFKDFSKFMSGTNNPWSYSNCLENLYEKKLAEEKKEAEIKAIAYQGFEGTEQDGNITYPGSLIKEKVANVENMGNEVIANANGIAEVITSAVMKMGMDAINNGIGNVQVQIQRGVTNTYNKATSQLQNEIKNSGPVKLFNNVNTTIKNAPAQLNLKVIDATTIKN